MHDNQHEVNIDFYSQSVVFLGTSHLTIIRTWREHGQILVSHFPMINCFVLQYMQVFAWYRTKPPQFFDLLFVFPLPQNAFNMLLPRILSKNIYNILVPVTAFHLQNFEPAVTLRMVGCNVHANIYFLLQTQKGCLQNNVDNPVLLQVACRFPKSGSYIQIVLEQLVI